MSGLEDNNGLEEEEGAGEDDYPRIICTESGDPLFVIYQNKQYSMNTEFAQRVVQDRLAAIEEQEEKEEAMQQEEDEEDTVGLESFFQMDVAEADRICQEKREREKREHQQEQIKLSIKAHEKEALFYRHVCTGVMVTLHISLIVAAFLLYSFGNAIPMFLCSYCGQTNRESAVRSRLLNPEKIGTELCVSDGVIRTSKGSCQPTEKMWRLHTTDTFPGFSPAVVIPQRDVEDGLFDPVVVALGGHLLDGVTPYGMLCMHHLRLDGHTPTHSVCVMKLNQGRVLLPMFNPELKGYSNQTRTVMETSIGCKGKDSAKIRRTAVDVEFLTERGIPMRILLDVPDESIAFQISWQELKATYMC